MSNLSEERHARALALEAASRIVSENLGYFIRLGTIAGNKESARQVTVELAKDFERFVREGSSQ